VKAIVVGLATMVGGTGVAVTVKLIGTVTLEALAAVSVIDPL
jgi:hypothetical protein